MLNSAGISKDLLCAADERSLKRVAIRVRETIRAQIDVAGQKLMDFDVDAVIRKVRAKKIAAKKTTTTTDPAPAPMPEGNSPYSMPSELTEVSHQTISKLSETAKGLAEISKSLDRLPSEHLSTAAKVGKVESEYDELKVDHEKLKADHKKLKTVVLNLEARFQVRRQAT